MYHRILLLDYLVVMHLFTWVLDAAVMSNEVKSGSEDCVSGSLSNCA